MGIQAVPLLKPVVRRVRQHDQDTERRVLRVLLTNESIEYYLKLNMKYSNALRLSWVMEGERRAERKVDRLGEQLEIWEMML